MTEAVTPPLGSGTQIVRFVPSFRSETPSFKHDNEFLTINALPSKQERFWRCERLSFCAAAMITACFMVVAFSYADAEEKRKPTAAEARIVQTVEFLASDELQGRGLGTRGLDRAAGYIGQEFIRLGLATDLCDGGPFQTFLVPMSLKKRRPRVDWWSVFVQGAGTDGAAAEKGGERPDSNTPATSERERSGPPLRYGPATPAPPKPEKAKPRMAKLKNVVAVLEGEGPRAEETIVVGAHYDHLGEDRDAEGEPVIYNGANDNASGTAAMLEVARMLSKRPKRLPRRIVFVAFSGEEHGLLGSLHWVNHPPVPLKKTIAMINLDMIGRMQGDCVMAMGTGSSPALAKMVKSIGKRHGLKLVLVPGQRACSDHAPFCSHGIPAVHFFTTGGMRDYHRPTDVAEKLNYEGIHRIALVTADLAVALAEAQQPPKFVGGGLQSELLRGAVRLFGRAVQGPEAEKPKPAKKETAPKKKADGGKSPEAAVAPGKPGR